MTSSAQPARTNWRSVALPAQHGAWGFWLEPALAGLIAAPSWAGVWLSLGALAVLLLHHPLMIALKDVRKGKTYARTRMAARFAAVYGLAAAVCLALAWAQAGSVLAWALVWAAPFAAVQFWYELSNEQRILIAELSGAAAFAVLAPAIALAAGWALPPAAALWMVLAVRAVTSILYVRQRLRLEKGKSAETLHVHAAHGLGVAVMIALAWARLAPWPVIGAQGILLARAWFGLAPSRKPLPAKAIGFREIAYGLLLALATGFGYRLL